MSLCFQGVALWNGYTVVFFFNKTKNFPRIPFPQDLVISGTRITFGEPYILLFENRFLKIYQFWLSCLPLLNLDAY